MSLLNLVWLPLLIVALLGAQFFVGFRAIPLAHFQEVHVGLAIALAATFLVHGFWPLAGLVDPMQAMQFTVLPVGLLLIALLAAQIVVGFRLLPLHRRFRPVHTTLAVALVVIGVVHGSYIAAGLAHPPGSGCESCHRPPAAHYAAPCLRCHTRAGVSWEFSHPAVNEVHSWTSFPCAKCHPSGNARVVCTCHRNGVPQGN